MGKIDAVLELINNPSLTIDFEEKENIIQFKNFRNMNESQKVLLDNEILLLEGLKKMASIRIRANGLYEARIHFEGKYYSLYERSLKKLNEKVKTKLKALKKGEFEKENYTFKNWYLKWFTETKEPFISKSTAFSIKNTFEKHILPVFKHKKLENIKKSDIQIFLNSFEKSRTKELISTYLKACLTQAFNERVLDFNPFNGVILDKKIKADKTGFYASEQREILNYLKNKDLRLYKIVLLYLCTGCRRNELLSIKHEDVKNGYLFVKGTKTENSKRFLKITKELKDFLLENLEILNHYKEPHSLTRQFNRALTELGIKNKSIHSLRHSFAMNHYYLGTPAKDVQNWLGHSSIKITMDIYTNIDPRIDRKKEKEEIKKLYNNLYYYTN